MSSKTSVLESHGSYWCNTFHCTSIMKSREEFLQDFCKDKVVLHVGCTDYPFDGLNGLHKYLDSCCTVDGVDIDKEGIEKFKKTFKGNFYNDISHVTGSYDIVLLPEVLEHIDSPGQFLNQINSIDFTTLLITVPDVLCCYNYNHFECNNNTYVEACHPDHVAWYSPHTLSNIIKRNTDCIPKSFNIVNGRSIMCIATKEKT